MQSLGLVDAHGRAVEAVAAELGVDPAVGLDPAEAARRAEALGPNELERHEPTSVWRLIVGAATEPFILLLAAAAAGAIVLGEVRDGLLILFGLVPIVGADVATEFRGERALEALRSARRPGRGSAGPARRPTWPRPGWCPATSCCCAPATSSRPTFGSPARIGCSSIGAC
jgi:magnesium-transporting ATPase (P-type)